MHIIFLMARYEYWRHVRRRAFVLTAFGMPLFMGVVFGVVYLVARRPPAEKALGIVDHARLITPAALAANDDDQPIALRLQPDEATARQALAAGTIDAVVIVPQDFVQNGALRVVARKALGNDAERQIRAVLRAALVERAPPETRERLREPATLVLRTLNTGREIGADNGLLFLLPYAFAVLFVMTTFTTSGYLLQAIAEEKEGRVMELLATTVSPGQMMAGKIIGLSAVGLTQMLAWVALAALGVGVLVQDWSWFSDVDLPPGVLGWGLLFFVLGYLLFAACYTALGAAVTTPQEAQPLAGPISLLASLPLFLLLPILSQPNGPLAIALSFVPFSAPMTMLMRLPLADVPAWQLAVSATLLAASATGAMWLAARVLRRGMLRYGKRLRLHEIFG